MSATSRLSWQIYFLLFAVTVVLFGFGVIVFEFSGIDLRMRTEKKACRGGDVERCVQLGKYYEDKAPGLIGFLMSNADDATTYYQKACSGKSSVGCERMLFTFKHLDQAKNLSTPLTDMADALIGSCVDRVTGACDRLSDFFENGDWVATRSAIAFKARCDAGSAEACFRLGVLHQHSLGGQENILEDVLVLYEKGCADHIEAACKAAEPYRAEQAKRALER